MATDQEKDKVIVEALGECWHEWVEKDSVLDDCIPLMKCRKCGIDEEYLPGFDEWEGFGWWWERAQKMEWWKKFLDDCRGYPASVNFVMAYLIHPTRGRDALYEFLIGRKA